ncbi:MAG TPA: DUF6600 domain-containing protein [Verrucomicrobiae bacterium]|jgi:hypothetical protein|nr:DUF6600 domain-containing protein [Verrucomicrobiae bacterium]
MKRIILSIIAAAASLSCLGQAANLSPNLQEVIKLTQAHMSDDVIVAYIRNSGAVYSLGADDILYLNSQGVSQPVISELLHTRQNAPPPAAPAALATPAPVAQPNSPAPAMAATPPDQPPPNSEVNLAYFQTQLSPAGAWVDVPGYGQCWRPTVVAQNPDWRPYCDAGHWVYSDDGWAWQSDYPWGDVAFHYGRWYHDWRWGWVWTPGYNWGPAWVSWRHAEGAGFCGWAPLPPEARFEVGVGLTFGGHVGLDVDFGLPASAYVFVPFDHFWDHSYHGFVAPLWRADALFRASVVINDYHFESGRFVVGGLGRERIAVLTHHEVPIERIRIRDERVARAREIQHVRSAEIRHDIRHDEAVRQERDIHHDVRQVEAAHHDEAVRRVETSSRSAHGLPASGGDRHDGRDDHNQR